MKHPTTVRTVWRKEKYIEVCEYSQEFKYNTNNYDYRGYWKDAYTTDGIYYVSHLVTSFNFFTCNLHHYIDNTRVEKINVIRW